MVQVTWNNREFNQELARIQARSKKSAAFIVNKQARKLAFAAFAETDRAQRSEITQSLNQPLQNSRSKDRVLRSMAAYAANARRVRKGQPRVWGELLKEKAKAVTNARIAAINYVRSGWLSAIQILGVAINAAPRTGQKRKNPVPGGATPATEARPVAIIRNRATAVHKVGMEGLRKAAVKVIADMKSYGTKRDFIQGVRNQRVNPN